VDQAGLVAAEVVGDRCRARPSSRLAVAPMTIMLFLSLGRDASAFLGGVLANSPRSATSQVSACSSSALTLACRCRCPPASNTGWRRPGDGGGRDPCWCRAGCRRCRDRSRRVVAHQVDGAFSW
jgi:hypothetical protein